MLCQELFVVVAGIGKGCPWIGLEIIRAETEKKNDSGPSPTLIRSSPRFIKPGHSYHDILLGWWSLGVGPPSHRRPLTLLFFPLPSFPHVDDKTPITSVGI